MWGGEGPTACPSLLAIVINRQNALAMRGRAPAGRQAPSRRSPPAAAGVQLQRPGRLTVHNIAGTTLPAACRPECECVAPTTMAPAAWPSCHAAGEPMVQLRERRSTSRAQHARTSLPNARGTASHLKHINLLQQLSNR